MAECNQKEIFAFPGRPKSTVWESFGFYKNDEGQLDKAYAICRLCRRGIPYSGNTTNLHHHMVQHHNKRHLSSNSHTPERVKRIKSENGDVILCSLPPAEGQFHLDPSNYVLGDYGDISVVGRRPSDEANGQATVDVMKADTLSVCPSGSVTTTSGTALLDSPDIMGYLIRDLQPLENLYSPAFRKLIENIQCSVPAPVELTCVIEQLYWRLRNKVTAVVKTAKAFHLNIDVWESRGVNFMTVSCRLMLEPWKVESFVLQTFNQWHGFSGTDISACLQELVVQWELPGVPVLMSGVVSEVAEAADHLPRLHLNCLSTVIDHAADAGFSNSPAVVQDLLDKARNIVWFMKKIQPGVGTFQDAHGSVFGRKNDWSSTYDMLERLDGELGSVFEALQQSCNHDNCEPLTMFSDQEQSLIHDLISAFRPLKQAEAYIADIQYPSASALLPILRKLELSLIPKESDPEVLQEIKRSVWGPLGESYSSEKVKDFLLAASLIDPRFKDLKFVNQSERDRALTVVKQDSLGFKPLADTEENQSSPSSQSEASSSETATNEINCEKNRPTSGKSEDWLSDIVLDAKSGASDSAEDLLTYELNGYLAERQIPTSALPLSWWKARQAMYPILAQVARQCLLCPLSLVSGSRNDRHSYVCKRSCLASEHVDKMLFIHHADQVPLV